MSDLSKILVAIQAGDRRAADQLLPLVYDELRELAAQKLAREAPGQTLQPTALVHEAYLRLVPAAPAEPSWNSRGHFFAAAAQAMRRILIENARQKGRLKHGGGRRRVEFTADLAIDMPPEQMLALDELLTRLAERDAQAARVVELHCFAGLPIDKVAGVLGVSPRTAYRDWEFARAWLFREVHDESATPEA